MEDKINVTVENLPKSLVKLTITTKPEDLTQALDKAYDRLHTDVEIKGFRKGKAPKQMIIEALGTKLYDEAINFMIWDLTNKAIAQEKLSPLTDPEFAIQEFALDKPIVYTVQFAVYPTITIGDLKEVKLKKEDVENARKAREEAKKPTEETKEATEEKTGEESTEEKEPETKEEKEPSFNLDAYYSDMLDKVFAISTIDVPDAVIDKELHNHVHSFTHRLEDLGISTEDYLKLQNTTLDEAKQAWRKDIEFSLKQDLLLSEYAKQKGIGADEAEVRKNLEEVYPPEQIEKLDPSMYNYVSYALVRQKAFLDLIETIENNNAPTK